MGLILSNKCAELSHRSGKEVLGTGDSHLHRTGMSKRAANPGRNPGGGLTSKYIAHGRAEVSLCIGRDHAENVSLF